MGELDDMLWSVCWIGNSEKTKRAKIKTPSKKTLQNLLALKYTIEDFMKAKKWDEFKDDRDLQLRKEDRMRYISVKTPLLLLEKLFEVKN